MSHTKFNLQRFLDAQEGVYPVALKEIRNGGKRSHWIWYIFPQQKGLGYSYRSSTDWTGKKRPGLIWHILYWVSACGKSPMPC